MPPLQRALRKTQVLVVPTAPLPAEMGSVGSVLFELTFSTGVPDPKVVRKPPCVHVGISQATYYGDRLSDFK